MFQDWDNYYLMIGSAAGALIGLLFVVATLTAGIETSQAKRGADAYMTPTVFHFGVVVVISAIAAVPRLSDREAGFVVAVCAVAGLVYAATSFVRIVEAKAVPRPHWSDKYYYALVPALAYVALAGSALAAWRSADFSARAVAGSALILGGGSMGLLHLLVLKAVHPELRVALSDPLEERRALALRLGADAAAAPGAATAEAAEAVSRA